MKVYVLFYSHYDEPGRDMMGIFTTKEKAERYREELQLSRYSFSIEEWDLD